MALSLKNKLLKSKDILQSAFPKMHIQLKNDIIDGKVSMLDVYKILKDKGIPEPLSKHIVENLVFELDITSEEYTRTIMIFHKGTKYKVEISHPEIGAPPHIIQIDPNRLELVHITTYHIDGTVCIVFLPKHYNQDIHCMIMNDRYPYERNYAGKLLHIGLPEPVLKIIKEIIARYNVTLDEDQTPLLQV